MVELVSNSNKKIKTKDCQAAGKYPVIDQGQQNLAGYSDDETLVITSNTNDPVILFGDHTRALKYIEQDFIPGADGTKLFRPKRGINPRFFFHILRAIRLPDRGYSRHYQFLRESLVPIPPFHEQKRIADKLDQTLGLVERARARLARVPEILKQFRQSVLAAATDGRLTEDWRANNGSAFTDWTNTTFGEKCIEITVGFVGKMSTEYRDKGIPFLRSLNVRPFRFCSDELRYISPEFHEQISKSTLRPGDVAVVRSGAPGQCCVIPKELPEANCSDLVIIRPGPELVSEFACLFINSEVSQSFVRREQVGVAQAHFNVGSMKVTPLTLPPVPEQREIVRRVETLFALADRIEARYQAISERVDKLTQSLLAKAFRGELVPQDPNDEPASVLLERIRAQRAAEPAPKRGRRKKEDQPA